MPEVAGTGRVYDPLLHSRDGEDATAWRVRIGQADHDAWLLCMDGAIERMDVADEFEAYFKDEIRVPAARVSSRTACGSSA